MGGYILCQIKRASMPYYIENISTNIYSIEELCYYFYHNIYLLDETILNEHLCDWIRKELGLERLYRRLYKSLRMSREHRSLFWRYLKRSTICPTRNLKN